MGGALPFRRRSIQYFSLSHFGKVWVDLSVGLYDGVAIYSLGEHVSMALLYERRANLFQENCSKRKY